MQNPVYNMPSTSLAIAVSWIVEKLHSESNFKTLKNRFLDKTESTPLESRNISSEDPPLTPSD